MTIYADYSYYQSAFGGNIIPEADFSRCALLATVYINRVTFGRIDADNVDEKIKMACCSAAEVYFSSGQTTIKAMSGISSETVGSYSVSYSTNSAEVRKSSEQAVYNAVKDWLGDTGLMYRGVDNGNECCMHGCSCC